MEASERGSVKDQNSFARDFHPDRGATFACFRLSAPEERDKAQAGCCQPNYEGKTPCQRQYRRAGSRHHCQPDKSKLCERSTQAIDQHRGKHRLVSLAGTDECPIHGCHW